MRLIFTLHVDLELFLWCLCDLFFIFIFISTMINLIISCIQTDTPVLYFLEHTLLLLLDDNEDANVSNFQIANVQPQSAV